MQININAAMILLSGHLVRNLCLLRYQQGRAVVCCSRDVQRALVVHSSAAISRCKSYRGHVVQQGS